MFKIETSICTLVNEAEQKDQTQQIEEKKYCMVPFALK